MAPGQSRRPDSSAFSQQTLKAWRPVLTPRSVILLFSVVGIIFIPVGAIILAASNQVVEVQGHDYSGSCCIDNCDATKTWEHSDANPCNITITVPKRMEPPIFFYYKLTNYYQNHRRYVRSRDDNQLKGDVVELETLLETRSCDYHVLADPDDRSSIISPCGLVAWSLFNDSFSLYSPSGEEVTLNEKGIAWPSDMEYKFKNSPNGSTGANFPPFAHWRQRTCNELPADKQDECLESEATPEAGWCYPGSGYCVEDEHFAVWMRAAGLPAFRKLYGRIENALEPGEYTVRVSNGVYDPSDGTFRNAAAGYQPQTFLYPVSTFGGTKAVVLSTTSWIGGKNLFLGYAYVVVGVICIVLALCFFIKYRLSPRELGDASYITWLSKDNK